MTVNYKLLFTTIAVFFAAQVFAQDAPGIIYSDKLFNMFWFSFCIADETSTEEDACAAVPIQDYHLGLRIGSIFIILGTSAIGTYVPILLHRFSPYKRGAIRDWLLTIGKFCKSFFGKEMMSTVSINKTNSWYWCYFGNCFCSYASWCARKLWKPLFDWWMVILWGLCWRVLYDRFFCSSVTRDSFCCSFKQDA